MDPSEWSTTCGVPSDEAPEGLAPLAEHTFSPMEEWVILGLLMRAKKSFNDIAEAMRYTHMIKINDDFNGPTVIFNDKPARRVTGKDIQDFGRSAPDNDFWHIIVPMFQTGLGANHRSIEEQIAMFFYNVAIWRKDHPEANTWEPAGILQNGTGA
ncbi:MAG: hypothetical protein LQ348_005107 [Seirophora lacunosa]|nr:MAG: hypothetical protein LQ348_005107 [Seirophora lacunosa]